MGQFWSTKLYERTEGYQTFLEAQQVPKLQMNALLTTAVFFSQAFPIRVRLAMVAGELMITERPT